MALARAATARVQRDDRPARVLIIRDTRESGEMLEAALEKLGRALTAALLIDAPDEEVVRRLSGRRTCVKNGHVYHVEFDPPKREGVCDQDGSRLVQRDDDKPETIKNRLSVYHEQTEPVVEHYRATGKLVPLHAERSVGEVFAEIQAALEQVEARA